MDFQFKKSLGQNFLQDKNILKKIVSVSDIKENSLVIEIGPGSGNLTKEIAKVANKVLCFEIDTRLEEILDFELREYNNIDIIYDDFLKRDIKKDLENYSYQNLYVVANLPYYITTPIIEKLIKSKLKFNKITVMVQKEVGDRFGAKPKTKDYNSLTVYLNYYFNIKREFIVSKDAFIPKPKVDSIVVTFESKEKNNYLVDEEFFQKLIKDAFRYKRKNIRNNLKNYNLEIVQKVLEQNGFSLNSRAEEFPLEIFIDLSNELSKLDN